MIRTITKPTDSGKVRESAYHAIIIDRSGSMRRSIKQACNDAAERVDLVRNGDRLRVMWYSSEGEEWGVATDGVLRTHEQYTNAQNAIRKIASTLGTTCFSEVLGDWAKSLQGWQGPKTLTLLTDGYPVVSNYAKEDRNIASALALANESGVTGAAFVGYENYDKERLVKMASTIGGTVVHASNIALFGEVTGSMIEDESPSFVVEVGTLPEDSIVFTLRDGYPSRLNVQDGKVSSTGDVFISSPNINKLYAPLEAVYGAAILWNQSGRGDIAQDILALTGDVALWTKATNAVTPDEHSTMESRVLEAIQDPMQRYTQGLSHKLAIDPHVYSLFSLLDDLQQANAKFVPVNEWRETYSKIGADSETDESVIVRFKGDYDNAYADFGDLVWASDRLNLSVRVHVKGRVSIPDEGQALGLPESLPSSVWRNYTIMRDGKLNVTTLPVLIASSVLSKLAQKGIVYHRLTSGIVLLDIGNLPVMNRSQSQARSLADIAHLLVSEQRLKCEQKVLNDLIAPHRQELRSEAFGKIYGQEAALWLSGQGVTDSGFSPKSKAVKVGDTYPAKLVKFALSGFSSLPKVEDVKSAIKDGKVTTPVKKAMALAIADVDDKTLNLSDDIKLSYADNRLRAIRNELSRLRAVMTAAKFGVAFAGRWFTDMSSRNDNAIEIITQDLGALKASVTVEEKQITI